MDFLHKASGKRLTERAVCESTGLKIGSEAGEFVSRGFYPIHLVMPEYNPCLYHVAPATDLTFHDDHYEQKFTLVPIELDRAKDKLMIMVNSECDVHIKELVATYPDMEVASFGKQESEARAILAGEKPDTNLLAALAQNRGIELQELCRRVVTKADEFAMASGLIIGQRQRMEDAINEANTFEELEKVDVNYVLPWKQS